MLYFLDDNGVLRAIEDDGSQDFLITEKWKPISDVEAEAILNPPKTFAELKTDKLEKLNENFISKSLRPRVEVVSLGYFVDGGRADLDNFKNGRDINYPVIMDADDQPHQASLSDYDAVIRAIQDNGAALIAWKWNKKSEINAIVVSDTMTEAQAITALGLVVIE